MFSEQDGTRSFMHNSLSEIGAHFVNSAVSEMEPDFAAQFGERDQSTFCSFRERDGTQILLAQFVECDRSTCCMFSAVPLQEDG